MSEETTQTTEPQGGQEAGQKGGQEDGREWLSATGNEELIGNKYLQRYATVEDAAKGMLEMRTKLSKNVPDMPGPEGTDEQWDKINAYMGCPEDMKDYDLVAVMQNEETGEPVEVPVNEDMQDYVRNVAKAGGLTKRQASRAIAEMMNQQLSTVKENAAWLEKENGPKHRAFSLLPQEIQRSFQGMPPKVLDAVLGYIGGLTHEDVLPATGERERISTDIHTQIQDLHNKKIQLDPMSPEFQRIETQLQTLYRNTYA